MFMKNTLTSALLLAAVFVVLHETNAQTPTPPSTRRPRRTTTGRPGECPPRCRPGGNPVCARNSLDMCTRFVNRCEMERTNCDLAPNARWTRVHTRSCAGIPLGQSGRCAGRTTRRPTPSTTRRPGPRTTTRRPGPQTTTRRPGSTTPVPNVCPPTCTPRGNPVCGRDPVGMCTRFANACEMQRTNCGLPPAARWLNVSLNSCGRSPIGQPTQCVA